MFNRLQWVLLPVQARLSWRHEPYIYPHGTCSCFAARQLRICAHGCDFVGGTALKVSSKPKHACNSCCSAICTTWPCFGPSTSAHNVTFFFAQDLFQIASAQCICCVVVWCVACLLPSVCHADGHAVEAYPGCSAVRTTRGGSVSISTATSSCDCGIM